MFGALVFLFPVAAYCLFVAMLNSRHHPTMISGPWDFAGVLFALSGFLLAGGPAMLGAFYSGWRIPVSQGRMPTLATLSTDSWWIWLLAWIFYFLLVAGGAF